MKTKLFFALAFAIYTATAFGQAHTETFETEAPSSQNFTDNGVSFSIISHLSIFEIVDFAGWGWNGTAPDNRFIDNLANAQANASFSITAPVKFAVSQFWLLPTYQFGDDGLPASVTFTGKLNGATVFTETKNTGFFADQSSNNGFTLIDMTDLNGNDHSKKLIDAFQVTLAGAYNAVALDAFSWFDEAAVLPVTFGALDAHIKNNALVVNWETETETNNSHFNIEASHDGINFTTIGTTTSKAINGVSHGKISYSWTSATGLPFLTIPLLGLLFLPVRPRRKATAFGLLIVFCLANFVTGCSKSSADIEKSAAYFIRIGQVDKDGTTAYSKTVRVQKD
ncbi:hypothetical protein ABDK00_000050 [Niabella insulamsoli]|uniref:hypothetical protein n=1 Tax=Niabella insulamsoli TaxID=3144874 RepID=UPI0031FD6720